MATPEIFDRRTCHLGEGALWHPERQQLFWFDILDKQLLSRTAADGELTWSFGEHVSAAGWIDRDTLLVASESALLRFSLESAERQIICLLEADNPLTRSNDGRADPWGGFWIGTMGKRAEPGAGAIYRYYRGELRRLFAQLTIPNAICFSPDGSYAYFADTAQGVIRRQRLAERDGWPQGEPEDFIDCATAGVHPDGAVVDNNGNLWNAQWGAGRVACYDASGDFLSAIAFPAGQVSCPAFGGDDLRTLFATSATENLSATELARQPDAGKTFVVATSVRGQREHPVIL